MLSPNTRSPHAHKFNIARCWAYFVLGVASTGMGVALLVIVPRLSGSPHPDKSTMLFSAVFVVFGLVRIGLALYWLRHLKPKT